MPPILQQANVDHTEDTSSGKTSAQYLSKKSYRRYFVKKNFNAIS